MGGEAFMCRWEGKIVHVIVGEKRCSCAGGIKRERGREGREGGCLGDSEQVGCVEGWQEGGQEGGWVGAELTGIIPRIDRMFPTAILKQYSRG